jgi:hypothetical protein
VRWSLEPVLLGIHASGSARARDLDVGLIRELPVPGGVPEWASGVGLQRCESLHPPVHRDVVDLDTALGQQLLHVPVGQAVAQVPADRDRDHLQREPEPGKRRPIDVGTGGSASTHPLSLLGQA